MDDKFVYFILETKYIKNMGREVSVDPSANADLFPRNWFLNTNYDLKIKILATAIEKDCLIENTSYYNDPTHII